MAPRKVTGSLVAVLMMLAPLLWASTQQQPTAAACEMASNRADDQEISMLSLHLLQLSLVYVNTVMNQQVLAEPAWAGRLNADDRRGITPLLHAHINPGPAARPMVAADDDQLVTLPVAISRGRGC